MNKLFIFPALLLSNALLANDHAILTAGSATTPTLLQQAAITHTIRNTAEQLPRARFNIPSMTDYPQATQGQSEIESATPAAVDSARSVHTTLARQASRCTIRAQNIAVDFGDVLPAEPSSRFTQRSYFEVDCPAPASYRLVLVDNAGASLTGDSLVLQVGNQPNALLRLSIDGRPPGKLMRHTGTQVNRHELLAELKNATGQPLTPNVAGKLSLPPNRFFVSLVPALTETASPGHRH